MALLQLLFVFFGERPQACQWQGGVDVLFSVKCAVARRRSGSRRLAKVDEVPGARGPAVKACRAADSSPAWTRCRACSLRRLSLGAAVGF